MKKLLLIILVTLLPAPVFAEDGAYTKPSWSIEMKGGFFYPDIDNWSEHYGNRYMGAYGGAVAYKILRQLEAGVEASYSRDKGQGFLPVHGTAGGEVTYETIPLNIFILARGIFTENQWLVPYAGGGYTRTFYREEVKDQSVARGAVNGFHARGGIQLLMDVLEPDAAGRMQRDYGITHTYLIREARYTRAMVDTIATTSTPSQSVNLGGKTLFGGFLFEIQ